MPPPTAVALASAEGLLSHGVPCSQLQTCQLRPATLMWIPFSSGETNWPQVYSAVPVASCALASKFLDQLVNIFFFFGTNKNGI